MSDTPTTDPVDEPVALTPVYDGPVAGDLEEGAEAFGGIVELVEHYAAEDGPRVRVVLVGGAAHEMPASTPVAP